MPQFMTFANSREASEDEQAYFGSRWVQVDDNDDAIIGVLPPDVPLPEQSPGIYGPGVVAAIVNALPSIQDGAWQSGVVVPARQRKMHVLLALIRTRGLLSWNDPPSSDPQLGGVWAAYESSEAEGDSAAATWPE